MGSKTSKLFNLDAPLPQTALCPRRPWKDPGAPRGSNVWHQKYLPQSDWGAGGFSSLSQKWTGQLMTLPHLQVGSVPCPCVSRSPVQVNHKLKDSPQIYSIHIHFQSWKGVKGWLEATWGRSAAWATKSGKSKIFATKSGKSKIVATTSGKSKILATQSGKSGILTTRCGCRMTGLMCEHCIINTDIETVAFAHQKVKTSARKLSAAYEQSYSTDLKDDTIILSRSHPL